MKNLLSWGWIQKNIPVAEKIKNRNQVNVMALECINPPQLPVNFGEACRNETVLITGDGHTLQADVMQFEAFGIDHDLYCVNRSALYFQRPISHWAAVDNEEAAWFSQNVNKSIKPNGHKILRHTIGILPFGFDVFWKAINYEDMTGIQKNLWCGNTTYMAILSALVMGYKKIVVAGAPLDTGPHWYDPPGATGPNWVGKVYRQWIDFKLEHPDSDRVRAMSGYSKFILGEPTIEWLLHK